MTRQVASDGLRDGDLVAVHADRTTLLKRLHRGKRISLHTGAIDCDALIGQPPGLRAHTHLGKPVTIARPTLAEFVLNMPRKSGIIYPKDLAALLVWTDIGPGQRVLTAGAGSGALTLALLQAVGATGRVYSYDVREDMLELTRSNAAAFFDRGPDTLRLRVGDVAEDIADAPLDRAILDLPEPWTALDSVAEALRPGGLVGCYLPSVPQVEQTVRAVRAHPALEQLDVFEALFRFWHVKPPSVRPRHEGPRHTGFLTLARRLRHHSAEPAAPEA